MVLGVYQDMTVVLSPMSNSGPEPYVYQEPDAMIYFEASDVINFVNDLTKIDSLRCLQDIESTLLNAANLQSSGQIKHHSYPFQSRY